MPGLNPAPDFALLPSIRALRVEIRTKWGRPTIIAGPIIANVLRGALGITLRKLVCPKEWLEHECPPCSMYKSCAYGQVFVPTPPADATQLRLQQDLPRPFVIEPPGLNPEESVVSEGITFRVVLFGSACESLPFLVSTLDRLGHDGMGPQRVPFTIERITACHPAGDEVLFTSSSTCVSLPQRRITTEDLVLGSAERIGSRFPVGEETNVDRGDNNVGAELQDAAVLVSRPSDRVRSPALPLPGAEVVSSAMKPVESSVRPRITIQWLTPLLLKSGSGIDSRGLRVPAQEIRERPPFGVIIRRLRDRISALSHFFGETWHHPDFASLGTLADAVKLVDSRTVWLTRNRRSTRTGTQHELSGLVGQASYEFPDTTTRDALLPLLNLGELLHVGKNAPWGNGAMRVRMERGA